MFDLHGRTAVVTGAGQNVGAGIAKALASQGAAVGVNDFIPERAQSVAAEIIAAGGNAVSVAFDVTNYDAVVSGMTAFADALGPIDILVNNAGNGGTQQMRPTQFRDSTPESWRGPIDVNLYGVMNCARAVINPMVERQWGRIITIASGAGTAGLNIGVSAYAGGKGGAISFMRHLAIENARLGVTANSLALGLMHIDNPEVTANLSRSIPVGRVGTPEDIAAACVWLASNEASWVTGQTIQINGGVTTT